VVEYSSAGGDWHRASLLGDGILNLFQLAIGILDMKDASTLVVDEPELSLHPQAQKTVAQYVKKFSLSHQVIVATHSPYFVDFETILDGAALYRFELVNGMTRVHQLSRSLVGEFRKTMSDYQKPQLLDVVAKEMLFSDGVMFVEGQEDVGLFRKVARETERPELPVFGYGIGGSAQIERFMKMAAELGIHCGALLDGTEREKLPGLQRMFPEFMIRALDTDDIRDKERQPAKDGRIGIFTTSGELKSEHRVSFLAMYDEFSAFFRKQ